MLRPALLALAVALAGCAASSPGPSDAPSQFEAWQAEERAEWAALSVPSERRGSLGPRTPRQMRIGGEARPAGAFTLPLRRGQRVLLRLTTLDDALATQLLVERDGEPLAHSPGGSQSARLVFAAPADGDYTVFAGAATPDGTGAYWLRVSAHEAAPAAPEPAPPATAAAPELTLAVPTRIGGVARHAGRVTESSPAAPYGDGRAEPLRLELTGRQRVRVRVFAAEEGRLPQWPIVYVTPDSRTDVLRTRRRASGADLVDFVLDKPDAYTLHVAETYGRTPFAHTVAVERLPDGDADGASSGSTSGGLFGAVSTGDDEAGDDDGGARSGWADIADDARAAADEGTQTLRGEITDSDADVELHASGGPQKADGYRVELRAGQALVLTMESDRFDTYLVVTRDRTRVAHNDDDGGSTRRSALRYVATEAGTYEIWAGTYRADGRGAYVVRYRTE